MHLSCVWLGVDLKLTPKYMCFKNAWTTSSKHANHWWHDWEDQYHDHLKSTRIFTLAINKICNTSSKNCEANGFGHDLEFLIISLLLHVNYPMRSGCKEKSICITYVHFMKWGLTKAQILWRWRVALHIHTHTKSCDHEHLKAFGNHPKVVPWEI